MGRSLPILGVPGVLGGVKPLIVTTFTQSLGDELVLNWNMEAGDPPTSWSVRNNSTLSSVADERTGGAGIAALKIAEIDTNYPGAQQSINVTAGWFETTGWFKKVDHAVHYAVRNGTNGGDLFPYFTVTSLDWTSCSMIFSTIGKTPNNVITPIINGQVKLGAGTELRTDDISIKRITLNAQQTMPSANAIIDFTYALPVSPVAGDTINVFYRISGASLEAAYTCWRAYIRRNDANTDWDFRLDSVSAGTATNRIAVTGVGNAVGIRVQCAGTLHDCWTTANGVDWTKRGAQINVSHNDTQTGVNTVYSSQATPTKLTVTPL